ncbi:MAG: hypothetical protein ABI586_06935 [Candidatus Nanopelagicales bacterium]
MSDSSMVGPYWWCLTHERVEGRDGCPNTVRLGPYDSSEDASHALERAHQRTKDWDSDPRWNDG